jgi:hypothetical protein
VRPEGLGKLKNSPHRVSNQRPTTTTTTNNNNNSAIIIIIIDRREMKEKMAGRK